VGPKDPQLLGNVLQNLFIYPGDLASGVVHHCHINIGEGWGHMLKFGCLG